jgi:hypothetical protein
MTRAHRAARAAGRRSAAGRPGRRTRRWERRRRRSNAVSGQGRPARLGVGGPVRRPVACMLNVVCPDCGQEGISVMEACSVAAVRHGSRGSGYGAAPWPRRQASTPGRWSRGHHGGSRRRWPTCRTSTWSRTRCPTRTGSGRSSPTSPSTASRRTGASTATPTSNWTGGAIGRCRARGNRSITIINRERLPGPADQESRVDATPFLQVAPRPVFAPQRSMRTSRRACSPSHSQGQISVGRAPLVIRFVHWSVASSTSSSPGSGSQLLCDVRAISGRSRRFLGRRRVAGLLDVAANPLKGTSPP